MNKLTSRCIDAISLPLLILVLWLIAWPLLSIANPNGALQSDDNSASSEFSPSVPFTMVQFLSRRLADLNVSELKSLFVFMTIEDLSQLHREHVVENGLNGENSDDAFVVIKRLETRNVGIMRFLENRFDLSDFDFRQMVNFREAADFKFAVEVLTELDHRRDSDSVLALSDLYANMHLLAPAVEHSALAAKERENLETQITYFAVKARETFEKENPTQAWRNYLATLREKSENARAAQNFQQTRFDAIWFGIKRDSDRFETIGRDIKNRFETLLRAKKSGLFTTGQIFNRETLSNEITREPGRKAIISPKERASIQGDLTKIQELFDEAHSLVISQRLNRKPEKSEVLEVLIAGRSLSGAEHPMVLKWFDKSRSAIISIAGNNIDLESLDLKVNVECSRVLKAAQGRLL